LAKSSEHLKDLAQLSISYERLRQIVEAEGQLLLEVQRKGLLAAEFSAQDCKTSPQKVPNAFMWAQTGLRFLW